MTRQPPPLQALGARVRTPSTGLRGVTNLAVLAPVRDGVVKGFEPISYVDRLGKVLHALQSARQNLRESELLPSFFVDTIVRLDIIHHFRYALVPPEVAGAPWRLSLNVTFDGGWEPYMRVIYRDIGPLLDLLFCHNDTYPGSQASFAEYCDWVRRNEIPAGFFYAEEAVTLQDQRYLAEVERAQRERNACDRDLARVALPPAAVAQKQALARALEDPLRALVLPLRTLKGLYRLSIYFPGTPAGGPREDATILRRFTQSVLADAIKVMQALDNASPETLQARMWKEAKAQFRDELAWLAYEKVAGPTKPEAHPCDPDKLQSHILASAIAKEQVTHGCVVLLRIRKEASAAATKTLQALAARCRDVARPGVVPYLIAFTYAGLKELGIAQHRLDAFPQEFYEGMEARHALLGDMRCNHPDRWARPLLANGPIPGQRVDLDAVHLLVHLRLQDPAKTQEDPEHPEFELHIDFAPLVKELDAQAGGLRVLAVEPLRTYRTGDYVSGHLKVADGLSQPEVPTGKPSPKWPENADQVNSGELVLGYRDNRGDKGEELDALLMDGSFLVVRKLRQRMDHLEAALAPLPPAQREEVLAKMVGRRRDGTPLAAPDAPKGSNAFDYTEQAASDACPFHSHIRRSNPRDGRYYTPRILRRGMSYGPLQTADNAAADRGVMFMAYCGSIAEQFETIQRWVSGGNSSGVGSAQADPLLRVPQEGETHTFRFLDAKGEVVRVTFGDKPLVQLQWGLYLFVPSPAALENLEKYRDAATAPAQPGERKEPTKAPATPPDLEAMRQLLEDRAKSPSVWASVRAGEATYQHTPYGRLVGKASEVLDILRDNGGPKGRYSVAGYGERMDKSVGRNLLGMDEGAPGRADQIGVNAVLRGIKEPDAFAAALAFATQVLEKFPPLPGAPGDIARKPIDLVNFSDSVLAALCTFWFGIPDAPLGGKPHMIPGGWLPDNPGPPRCPGDLLSVSRYVFRPHPGQEVQDVGEKQGQAVRAAIAAWLQGSPNLPGAARAIQQALQPPANNTLGVNLAGVLLGFVPTVQGNFLKVMEKWITEDEPSLWELQQKLFEEWGTGPLTHQAAADALREPLFKTMRKDPVPAMLWRKDKTAPQDADTVVLGIASALTDKGAPDELMFGRDGAASTQPTFHGCPGYEMAMGVLLGMMCALMKAGTLRPTGSPVLLILTPNT